MKAPRPYLNVMFKCCNVYTRVYLNKDGTAFKGACPKCARPFTVQVAKGGSSSKFWEAS